MDESVVLIDYALVAGSDHQKALIGRLTEKYSRYMGWEYRHAGLMKKVADSDTRYRQIYDLRVVTMSMVHLGALTRYLKKRKIRGRDRKLLVAGLHRHQDYIGAILREHTNYIRAEASSLCTRYLGIKLGDAGLGGWYGQYRRAFDDYFETFCDGIVADGRGESFPMEVFLKHKKGEVARLRAQMLNSPHRPPWTRRDISLHIGIDSAGRIRPLGPHQPMRSPGLRIMRAA